MFTELLKCGKCERYTIHRILADAELATAIAEYPAAGLVEPDVTVSYSCCAECGVWRVHSECVINPPGDFRRKWGVSLTARKP